MLRRAVAPLPFDRIHLSERVRHYRCPRDWTWQHRLKDYDLWLVLNGRGRLLVNGVGRTLEAPMATLLRPGDDVVGNHDPAAPLEVVALHFTPQSTNGRGSQKKWSGRLVQVPLRPVARFRELAEHLAGESSVGDPLAGQLAPALAFSLIAAVWRLAHADTHEEGDDRVDGLLRQIQREPWREWQVPGMARDARMGATRLNERVRQLTGLSPMRWVIRCRLERACVLLRETELKLTSIAEACGYRDVYFFVRQFRQAQGCPPATWRKRIRERS